MNRLFFRFFVLVMLAITAATFAIYFAISRLYGDPLEDIARRQAAAEVFLLEQYVDQAPADEWLVRLNKLREVSTVRYELLPLEPSLAALPAADAAVLRRGGMVFQVGDKAFLRRVDLAGERYIGSEAEVLRAEGLPINIAQALQQEALRYAIVALALLIPIALWSRAHWRGMQALARVADEFGAGQLSARARMPASASIYPLAERMDNMADRIERLMEAQRTLLHSVSHEVRTPIARLEFGLELLRTAADAAARPALEERIAAMEQDLRELNGLMTELLGMAKLDSGQAMQRQPFDLAAALHAAAAAAEAGGTALATRIGDLGQLDGDGRLLMRAVANLLGNAAKYGAGRVLLDAERQGSAGPGQGGAIVIAVEDDGPGIPAAERERVFAPFYRLDRSRDRASGGFGLGLSIAHKAVALHGGSLHVEDGALGGARFVIRLPG
ncbi:sensor protein RstB [Massilia sp. Root351]|uniref:ATP-binding protein n=1 Tax=Massilia sp. Root351 TaxID=1736522 RepID=UPI00070D7448|nr:ATP-binding protein [Massilia sp. Root351]KQV89953.1 sensor protein RstB [Massilia sp. Root351]